ncbi:MAG: glycosyltransferase family 2 protein [Acidobacteriota bacterium]
MKVKLSIIIVNWNTTDFLIKCLESIFENPPNVRFEIFVVDNNSDDDVCRVKELFPDIRLIKSDYNYGFGVGTNIGFRFSSSEYVMTLNPDTILPPETINKLIRTLEENKEIGIAAPVLKEQKVTKSQYSFFNLFFNSVILRKCKDFFAAFQGAGESAPFDVEFISGTGYVCRTSALTENRVFSEDNFLFGEEYYLCRQMLGTGYKIRVVPAARFEHHSNVTFKNDFERLSMASKLGASISWRIRKEYWGKFLGIIGSSLLYLEIAVKWAAMLSLKSFSSSPDAHRKRIIGQCKSILLTYLPLLSDADKYLAEVNEQSKVFFNSGHKPLSPPTFKEVGNRLTADNS